MLGGREGIRRKEVGEDRDLQKIVEVGKRHRQLGLYLYLVKKGSASFGELYTLYNTFSRHRVTPDTVRQQLKMLERKGLVRCEGGTYEAIEVPSDALRGLFDNDRSRAGRIGAQRSLQYYLYSKYNNVELPAVGDLSPRLKRKIDEVLVAATKLAREGKREAALDLICHTLLPIRQTGVLWLWRGEEFIYYERKVMVGGAFHSIRFQLLSKLLKDLGFEEGIMVYHTLGAQESKRYLKRILGHTDTYPTARSLFYKLKQLGLTQEGFQHVIEVQYISGELELALKSPEGRTLQVFTLQWYGNPPPPLEEENDKKVYISLGVQHVKKQNEGSYLSRF